MIEPDQNALENRRAREEEIRRMRGYLKRNAFTLRQHAATLTNELRDVKINERTATKPEPNAARKAEKLISAANQIDKAIARLDEVLGEAV